MRGAGCSQLESDHMTILANAWPINTFYSPWPQFEIWSIEVKFGAKSDLLALDIWDFAKIITADGKTYTPFDPPHPIATEVALSSYPSSPKYLYIKQNESAGATLHFLLPINTSPKNANFVFLSPYGNFEYSMLGKDCYALFNNFR